MKGNEGLIIILAIATASALILIWQAIVRSESPARAEKLIQDTADWAAKGSLGALMGYLAA